MFLRVTRVARRVPMHARSIATQRKGYEAFGSFHTPSTDALFVGEMPDELSDPATFLPRLTSEDRIDLAAAARNRALFTIDFSHWTYLNHGAFGGPTRFASRVAAAWREFSDAQPLQFNDRLLFPYVVQSIVALARVLNVKRPQELVLLPNATSGLHAVLASVLARAGDGDDHDDVVFIFSVRYGAVRKMLQSIEATRKLAVHEEPLTLVESYNDETVLHKLAAFLTTPGRRCPLVVVDHITSNTGVILPVANIVAMCHEYGVPVLVDGAHGLFNLDLDLEAINADYYVGNCHKWFASPKGAAFLHVNKRSAVPQTQQVEISPRVVSHGFFDGFQSAFMWSGLHDYSPWLSLPQCIAFWEQQNAASCREYMHNLAHEATELLYDAWGMTRELAAARAFPKHKRHAMRLVQLPAKSVFGVKVNGANSSADAKHIQDALHYQHKIEVPVKCVDGQLYVRISAHVYNHRGDYERLARVIDKS